MIMVTIERRIARNYVRRMHRKISLLVSSAAIVVACSDLGPAPHGVVFTHGNNATGEAGLQLPEPLVVEIHDSTGARAPQGVVVRFSGVIGPAGLEAAVRGPTSANFSYFQPVETDASGRASVDVTLGTKAGPARVLIEVPTLAIRDTARFTVVPGAANRITIGPGDTAVYVGASYVLNASVADRFGNPRDGDAVTVTPQGTGISVTNGNTIHSSEIGRFDIRVIGGGAPAVTAHVSVVPHGKLAAWRNDGRIVSMELDGSSVLDRAPAPDGGIGVHPSWIPGTDEIVYAASNGVIEQLRAVNAAGQVRVFFTSLPAPITHQAEPTPSADGRYLYFIAWDTRCGADIYCLHRSNIDGSGIQLLKNGSGETRMPAPSPDGAKVAYVKANVVHILRVADSTVLGFTEAGFEPRWAPDGTRIAYGATNGGTGVTIINPNGTNSHAVAAGLNTVPRPLAWSADAQWILAKNELDGRMYLIDAIAGTSIVLPYSGNLLKADLRP
jgi:Tol biopolymer transport system component